MFLFVWFVCFVVSFIKANHGPTNQTQKKHGGVPGKSKFLTFGINRLIFRFIPLSGKIYVLRETAFQSVFVFLVLRKQFFKEGPPCFLSERLILPSGSVSS